LRVSLTLAHSFLVGVKAIYCPNLPGKTLFGLHAFNGVLNEKLLKPFVGI
jgi:hypothetical protein